MEGGDIAIRKREKIKGYRGPRYRGSDIEVRDR